MSGRAIGQGVGPFLLGAVRAAIDDIALLDAMPDDPYTAMRACRRELVDRTLEAVERVGLPAQAHLERLVVVIAALVALSHGRFLLLSAKTSRPAIGSDQGSSTSTCLPLSTGHSAAIVRHADSLPRTNCRSRRQQARSVRQSSGAASWSASRPSDWS